ncbi:MAG TPA: ABC transporter permease subunit [Acidimicrobiia bacterium]|nr:ABC transporter permease subunit [Acidimicrobiia bacterium]
MTSATVQSVSERPEVRLIVTIAFKEIRDAARSRWFWMWTAAFTGLAAFMASAALPGSQVSGAGTFGRTAASLVALTQIIVPLMGLTLGAHSIAGQRESGSLRFLLSHPISRTEVFLGTFLGLSAALAGTVLTGFGAAGILTVARGGGTDATSFITIAILSWLLAVAMLGVGMLISTFAATTATALGIAVFVWLVLAFIGDLGFMGTSAATSMPTEVLLLSAVVNPVEAFRLASLTAFEGSLDVLGPAGQYAVDRFGDGLASLLIGVLALWSVLPAAAAWARFARKGDV